MMVDYISECLHHLRHDALILHGDVSVRNIMCEITEDGPNFILGDFDLAATLNPDGPPKDPAGQRHTGTLPFMALELLEDMASKPGLNSAPVVHELHHDYESLYWVTLWCTMKVDYCDQDAEDQKRIDAFVNQWEFAVGGSKTMSDSSRGSDAWSNSSRGSRTRADAGLDSQNQRETFSTGSEACLNLDVIVDKKSMLLLTGAIMRERPPTTEEYTHFGIPGLVEGFRQLIASAYVLQPAPSVPSKRRVSHLAKSRKEYSSFLKGRSVGVGRTAQKVEVAVPVRDLITREAIKELVDVALDVAVEEIMSMENSAGIEGGSGEE
ncbi:hypothetical protein C8Q70DRAFT_978275 [Cubamyces menziesii]|nr:hypothetical protein C8Q70DRAFT_978275 [Cubamyces menziesii]